MSLFPTLLITYNKKKRLHILADMQKVTIVCFFAVIKCDLLDPRLLKY
jgi:hypothetical protein